MIPLHLSISGFLSYRDPVELDLSTFHLACISGANGAGKSSLLDAVTWALFGVARKRDETVINLQSNTAEVLFTFTYEGNTYRVWRSLTRGKPTRLELNLLSGGDGSTPTWRPLTEHTVRETQARLEHILRMDYETFINASFFLQGKADQFTQQRSGDRKRILGSILGLEAWEGYRERAAAQRKKVESNIDSLDGRLTEIQGELNQEPSRKSRLAELQGALDRAIKARETQAKALEAIQKAAAELAERQRWVDTLLSTANRSQRLLTEHCARRQELEDQRQGYAALIQRAEQIKADYAAWQALRQQLAQLDETALRFHQHEIRRQPPLREIEVARAQLGQEQRSLLQRQADLEALRPGYHSLLATIQQFEQDLAALELLLQQRDALQAQLASAGQTQADTSAENKRLHQEMNLLDERIDKLQAVEGAACPLCGQPLNEADRQALVADLTAQGTQLGNQYRANQATLHQTKGVVEELNSRLAELSNVEKTHRPKAQSLEQHKARARQFEEQLAAWQADFAPRLALVTDSLAAGDYALEARQVLAQVEAELKTIGYDTAAHEAVRQAELQARPVEADFRDLEKATAALVPLQGELDNLEKLITSQEAETRQQQQQADAEKAALDAARAQAPDPDAAEQELYRLREEESRLQLDVGRARQQVDVLDDLKARQKELTAQREAQARLAGQYKQLERAFSKDGVPALLIEQALPEIEAKANQLLDQLSGGSMSVRFTTQAPFKDKKREDLKETLDILISDSAGTRDYELYSGGEAFRVNFAIRLALSEVLAQRAGARLQTLVIDEGFGSQDTQGRQRLIEAINLVEQHFAKILVITHIDELKDAFPTRIEVEKTERGSTIRVV